MRRTLKGGSVALSALALMVLSGFSASAAGGDRVVSDAIDAVDAVPDNSVVNAIDVTTADVVISTESGTSVELSSDAADGLTIDTQDGLQMGVGLPFAEEAKPAKVINESMVYDNGNGSTTTPLVQEDGTVQILTTIADASAPTEFAYDFAEGTGFRKSADGSVTLLALVDGVDQPVGIIAAPWATDARGLPVATHYEVRGGSLIQIVDHRAAATTYPVVADPTISLGWWRYIHFNRAETKTILNGGWSAAAIAALCQVAGGPIVAGGCLAQFGSIVYTAGVAENSKPKRCLVLKMPHVGSYIVPSTYKDSRCK